MLRLVHPAKQGQETSNRKNKKSSALFPTAEEVDRIRAAIRNLRTVFGGWTGLAAVTGVNRKTLEMIAHRRNRGSYAVAVALSRAAGVPVEQILRPGVQEVGTCAFCGRKGAK